MCWSDKAQLLLFRWEFKEPSTIYNAILVMDEKAKTESEAWWLIKPGSESHYIYCHTKKEETIEAAFRKAAPCPRDLY